MLTYGLNIRFIEQPTIVYYYYWLLIVIDTSHVIMYRFRFGNALLGGGKGRSQTL